MPYEDLCRLFFKSHEPSMGSSKRQYMSAIFAHTDEQFETASRVLHAVKESKTRVSTAVEMATDFYEAEYYHQKWLLQRKADWFKRLDMVRGFDCESWCNASLPLAHGLITPHNSVVPYRGPLSLCSNSLPLGLLPSTPLSRCYPSLHLRSRRIHASSLRGRHLADSTRTWRAM